MSNRSMPTGPTASSLAAIRNEVLTGEAPELQLRLEAQKRPYTAMEHCAIAETEKSGLHTEGPPGHKS